MEDFMSQEFDEYGYRHCDECGVPLAYYEKRVCGECAEPFIRPFFRWYDLWIGAYVDTANRAIYICPLPMIGVKIQLKARE